MVGLLTIAKFDDLLQSSDFIEILLNCKAKETDMQLTLTQAKLEKKSTCYQFSTIGITECYVYHSLSNLSWFNDYLNLQYQMCIILNEKPIVLNLAL